MGIKCEHEWIRPHPNLPDTWNLRVCTKCGKSGKLLKCKRCGEYTIHEYVGHEFRYSSDGYYSHDRDITLWKCIKCGNKTTTVQVWGSKPGYAETVYRRT